MKTPEEIVNVVVEAAIAYVREHRKPNTYPDRSALDAAVIAFEQASTAQVLDAWRSAVAPQQEAKDE